MLNPHQYVETWLWIDCPIEPALGCICINSLITNFLNLIIYNLQSPCTFSNRIYRFCVKKDGVVLVSKSAELSYGQNQWWCTWVGLCCAKKLWSNQWKRCWATASTAKSARIDLCNYFSKRAMHWLIYLMQLDCDDDKYEEE